MCDDKVRCRVRGAFETLASSEENIASAAKPRSSPNLGLSPSRPARSNRKRERKSYMDDITWARAIREAE